ncbi:hypothetical protein [Rhizobium gallicum]|uniref:hypothetical protein n=1 Tax=Rhizobium gallicum TaxID=56730 RepID=UPI001EF8AE7C|nr:hypothetical protein [Rhizobium gallicum]ULJ73626.1 hypothetical protein L2W42_08660 [Rhizobium gallicum]
MIEVAIQVLKYFCLAMIIGGFFGCAVCGLAICMRSSQISRDEEAGATEDALLDIHHFNSPDASGSKLGVRASIQSPGGA